MHGTMKKLREMGHWDEPKVLGELLATAAIDETLRNRFSKRAEELVQRIRDDSDPTMMELFLGEYGLSSEEGVALMCLAEALLRVPDSETMDALIEDKIASSEWDKHLGQSHSSLINVSTWALFMTGKVLNEDHELPIVSVLHSAVKRLGEPVIRQAVSRVMKELGQQFVLGETIDLAMGRAAKKQEQGYTYSYDMLGEAACTDADAKRFHLSYTEAISRIARESGSDDIRQNPGISVKLSALHARYETLQKDRVMTELLPRIRSLCVLAKSAGIGLNIDAEEAGRLELSLDVIEALMADAGLKDWDGFGIVVQAYGLRASAVIDWLYEMAVEHDRKIMVRLVKGAYWDTEIKHAQVEGLPGFPVFTRKASTDVSYICCAKKLLGMVDRIYPQFATHNAHSVAAILELADDKDAFEFQRLHGMGEALHHTVLRRQETRCRIYAPVGAHKDLLAYLVRRLLENGANSSFVNQIVDETIPPSEVAADPFSEVIAHAGIEANDRIRMPDDLFAPSRVNSQGWDIEDAGTLGELQEGIGKFLDAKWQAGAGTAETVNVTNPSNGEIVGTAAYSSKAEVADAIGKLAPWDNVASSARGDILRKAADLYESNRDEIFALLMREAGKTIADCIGELREAVDFLRYYAWEAEKSDKEPAGIFACISPWNFPLAIFTGQVAAALAAGNAVVAKPAEATPLVAEFAVRLLKEAGVPEDALVLLHGTGTEIGAAMTSDPHVNGVCFTGSTATAQHINRSMAEHLAPHAPLVAETGGLNAMIVDSTALPEQAVVDIIASAFQSAGQRCSALRVLYLQQDIAEPFLEMLCGAMDELKLGDPTELSTDIGPVIDTVAKSKIDQHVETAKSQGRLVKQITAPRHGTFVGPALIRLAGIEDLEEEIFGPVLHVATYEQEKFGDVIDQINASGFGLTFGMHSRIDHRVEYAVEHVKVGNIYINRNQIGAVVGSQPFGGEGLSGTGPKAGGPKYVERFRRIELETHSPEEGSSIGADTINREFEALAGQRAKNNIDANAVDPIELPGPTGESNLYRQGPRGRVLCLGPTAALAKEQAAQATQIGCMALAIAPGSQEGIDGTVQPDTLIEIDDLDAVVCSSDDLRSIRQALAKRDGSIVPLLSDKDFAQWLTVERHTCINTTAAGGNASLLAEQ